MVAFNTRRNLQFCYSLVRNSAVSYGISAHCGHQAHYPAQLAMRLYLNCFELEACGSVIDQAQLKLLQSPTQNMGCVALQSVLCVQIVPVHVLLAA